MDSEIKRRIAQIRRGEVPEGYKRIQRDIVPKDWTIKSLADVCNNFSYGMNAAAKAYDGYNKYIRITDIDDNSHIYTGLDIVSPDADLELKYRVQENDILFAKTGATVGKTYLYNKNDGILFFAGFMIRANVPMDNSYYVYEQTLTRRYLNWVRIMSQRSGQPGINAQEYGTYTFPYCRVEEQQKIAAILTTQDKVIELKEKRLAEKQRQKKYLMQQLLTVRKRLPGYIGEWTTLPLKYLSEKITSGNQLVNEGDGLYLDEASKTFYFKGVNVNNYLYYSGNMWRIIKVNKDDSIVLILNQPITSITYGTNSQYQTSSVHSYLNKIENQPYTGLLEQVLNHPDSYLKKTAICTLRNI